jgi:Nucleotidyl transferase AbiEii toxin, Type IV TA system
MTTREPALDQKVVEIEVAFRSADISHAFGGALALAYYAEPRGTIDIDVNVFVPPRDVDRVADALVAIGARADDAARELARRDGQVRIWWSTTPLDLFFSYDRFHTEAAARVRRVPFGDATITILAPEDLLVCKAVFDRRKDWIDIEQMLVMTAGELDVAGIRRQVARVVGTDDNRLARLDQAIDEILGL